MRWETFTQLDLDKSKFEGNAIFRFIEGFSLAKVLWENIRLEEFLIYLSLQVY